MDLPPEIVYTGKAMPSQGFLFSNEPEEGAIIGGKHRLTRKISEGSGGAVWEAADPTGREIALKFLKWNPLKSRQKSTEHFKNEFAILKSLSHPNISNIYDFGTDADTGLYFFTTELFREGNLLEIVGDPIGTIEALLLQALRALEYLRGHRLLHLDIKPQNLMLRRTGKRPELALIDFGLATFRPSDRPGGTANYMPPEIAARRLGHEALASILPVPDHRSDLYSLGVTFYYCLTGIAPFKANRCDGAKQDVDATLIRHLEYTPPPPSSHNRDVPLYLDRIIMKLISKFPDDRYPSAIVAAQALQYSSPHRHAPETPQTLLSYLPREGRLIGRHSELSMLELGLKAVADATPYAAPAICIAGGSGMGRSRILSAAKPIAQRLEMDTTFIGEDDELTSAVLESMLQDDGSSKSYAGALLVDDIDRFLANGTADEAAKDAFSNLVRRLMLQQRLPHSSARRLALVFTINSDRTDASRFRLEHDIDESLCHAIELANFTEAEVAEYLAAVLGEAPDRAVTEQLLRCTNGNPRFITEHLEEMIAEGRIFSLAGRPDAKTLKTIGLDFSHTPPPKSLADEIKSKLAALPPDARDMALLIACWMRPVSIAEITTSSGIEAVSEPLRALVGAGIVEHVSGDGRFAFTNTLAPKVIVQEADRSDVARHHDSILKNLALAKCRDRGELDLHEARCSDADKRSSALSRLIESAIGEGRHQDAVELLSEILKLTPAGMTEQRADALLKLGQQCEKAHRFKEAVDFYRKLGKVSAPKEDARRHRVVSEMQQGLLAMRHRRLDDAKRHLSKAIKLTGNSEKMLALRLKISNYLAGCELRDGKFEEAVARFERSAKVAKLKLSAKERLELTNNELGEALFQMGDVARAQKALAGNLEFAKAIGDVDMIAKHHYAIGNCLRHHKLKRYDEALEHYGWSLKLARSRHLVELQVKIQNGLGNLYLTLSKPQKAMHHYGEGLKLAQQVADDATCVELMIGMGLAAQKMQNPNDIIEYFEAALDFSSGPKGKSAGIIRRYYPAIFVSLGDAYYQKHDTDHALSYLKRALALDKKRQLTPDIRYSLYGTYSEILIERGDLKAARKQLPTLKAIAKAFPQAKAHLEKLSKRLTAAPA